MQGICDQYGPPGGAANDQQLSGLQEHLDAPVLHQIAAEDSPKHHDDADNSEHFRTMGSGA